MTLRQSVYRPSDSIGLKELAAGDRGSPRMVKSASREIEPMKRNVLEHETRHLGRIDEAPREPLNLLARFGAVAVFSVTLGALVPGLVAYRSNVFLQAGIDKQVFAKYTDLKALQDQWEVEQKQIKERLEELDAQVVTEGATSSVLQLRRSYTDELRKKQPASIQPFYLHLLMYFWPIMYFCLGSVAYIARPPLPHVTSSHRRWGWVLCVAAFVFVLQVSPLLFRNYIATCFASSVTDVRTVYAYCNWDIDHASFVTQLFNFALFSVLLSIIWVDWSMWTTECRRQLERETGDELFKTNIELLFTTIRQWVA